MRGHLLVSLVFVCVVYFSFDWKTLTYRRVYLLSRAGHGQHLRRGTETTLHRVADVGQIRQGWSRWDSWRYFSHGYPRWRLLWRQDVGKLRGGEQRIRRVRRRVGFVLLGQVLRVRRRTIYTCNLLKIKRERERENFRMNCSASE